MIIVSIEDSVLQYVQTLSIIFPNKQDWTLMSAP